MLTLWNSFSLNILTYPQFSSSYFKTKKPLIRIIAIEKKNYTDEE